MQSRPSATALHVRGPMQGENASVPTEVYRLLPLGAPISIFEFYRAPEVCMEKITSSPSASVGNSLKGAAFHPPGGCDSGGFFRL